MTPESTPGPAGCEPGSATLLPPVEPDAEGHDTLMSRPYGIFLTAFLADLAVACVGLCLQYLSISMGAVPRVLGMLGAFGGAGYAASCLTIGGLCDRIGRKRSAIIGVGGATIMWIVYPFVPDPVWLLALVPFGGAFLGFLWPAMQAWLAERTPAGPRALNRNVGLFNMAWSSGILLGPLLAGLLWRDHLPKLPFFICAGIGAMMIGVLLATKGGGSGVRQAARPAADHAAEGDPRLWRAFLWLAWLGNFASWYGGSTIQTMFPKLGLGPELHLSHLTVSTVVFSYWGGLLAVFFIARLTQRWQYRLGLLMASQMLSVAGMLMAALLATTALQFALCFALSGAAGGITYVSSLFYSINGPARSCGRRTAWHEGILGTGGLLGGLLSGEIAMAYGLRAPYIGAAILVSTITVVQLTVWFRCTAGAPASADPQASTGTIEGGQSK